MNRVVFTLASVSVVCACGLVIDPDDLVAGNGVSDSADASDAATAVDGETPALDAMPDAVDADSDAGTIIVDVPECVPTRPASATGGPYAVVIAASAPSPPPCPAGYLSTPVTVAKGDFSVSPVECNDASGCSCAATGAPTCSMRLRYFNDGACTQIADTPTTVGNNCTDIDSEQYYKVEYSISGLTCSANGPTTTTPSSKPDPLYTSHYVICAPDPAVPLAVCKGGEVGLPKASAASACVVVPTNVTCSGSYNVPRSLSKDGAYTDTRACTCGCGTSQASCTGGSVTTYTNLGCSASPRVLALGVCTERDGDDTAVATAPSTSGAVCAKTATPGGTATATTDMKLCCLGGG